MDARLAAIAQRISLLSEVDTDRQVFGADTHDYQLAAPLTGDDLGMLEAKLGIALPDEVRGFLRHVGAGGAGPFYGLLPITGCDEDRNVIRIADQGCGMSSLLIVGRDHRGEVWTDFGERQLAPEAPSFLAWYEAWIERALVEWATQHAQRLALDGPDRPADLEAAMLAFEILAPRSELTVDEATALGYLHLRERRAADAEAAFVRASKAPSPHSDLLPSEREARLHRDRANVAYVFDDHATAIDEARAGLAINNIWFSTGDELREILERALHASGESELALAVLDERAQQAYFDFALHHRLATEHLARGNVKAAMAALERAAHMPNIGGHGATADDRVKGAFEPMIAALRAGGRTADAEALEARVDLLLNAN